MKEPLIFLPGSTQNMNRYQELCVNTVSAGDEADPNKKMDKNSEQFEKYATLVENIQTKNMDIFRDIHLTLHPPTQCEATPRQPQVPIQVSASFKPCMDLKPSILQRDCTLKEVERYLQLHAIRVQFRNPNRGIVCSSLC